MQHIEIHIETFERIEEDIVNNNKCSELYIAIKKWHTMHQMVKVYKKKHHLFAFLSVKLHYIFNDKIFVKSIYIIKKHYLFQLINVCYDS